MTSNVFTSAGTVMSHATGVPASNTKAGFEALAWQPIGEVTAVPEFGRLYSLVTHLPLAGRQTVKRKGSFNDGSTTIQYAIDESDTGQSNVEGLIDSDVSQSFRIVLQSGKHIYFIAQIMSNPITIGSVDDITTKSVQLEITDEVLFEAAP